MSESNYKTNYLNDRNLSSGHRKTISGSIFSKLSFLRSSRDDEAEIVNRELSSPGLVGLERTFSKKSPRAIAVAVQQTTRRRRGSLRKAALLGRGAQRETKEAKTLTAEPRNKRPQAGDSSPLIRRPSREENSIAHSELHKSKGIALGSYSARAESCSALMSMTTELPMGKTDHHMNLTTDVASPNLSSTSTTDDDEIVSLDSHRLHLVGSGSDSYFPPDAVSLARHLSVKKSISSPLPIPGLVSNPLPNFESEWDYSETEWWGWVLLFVTWIVFVVGMGSCLGVWSWAWDVGETPYAPPELEDDPTLPIVGYYPALIILTSVMAWVWVIVAWVGMKYFRHTKISGD
ncbi:hypothetical protein GcM1_243077 [Golovinomyces cichoracearum]|uniref:Uncharacterized protein n=1 Tax=Golovinomyces cichoracearum TaxID=62708 RepID=A0A420IGD3_9PEZI|nr:hypothetical protein GcM1_243077 [Golovinomyces cichoracearum]